MDDPMDRENRLLGNVWIVMERHEKTNKKLFLFSTTWTFYKYGEKIS